MVFSNTYYFVSTSVFVHVYVLVDVLDFVIVLIQSGIFEYILDYSGWGGAVLHICRSYLCTLRKLLRGYKNEVARDVWGFQRSPSRLLSSMGKRIFIPEGQHATANINNYGL